MMMNMNWLTYTDGVGKTNKGRKAFVKAKVTTTAKPTAPSPTQSQSKPKPQPTSASKPTASPAPDWTAQEDSLLLDLQSQGKTWKQIHASIPRHNIASTKKRFKELQSKGATVTVEAKSPKNPDNSAAGSATDLPKSALKKPGSPRSGEGAKVVFVEEGGELDATTLAQLYKLHARADRDKWIEISSRYFDKTGRRIEPGVLREKMEGL